MSDASLQKPEIDENFHLIDAVDHAASVEVVGEEGRQNGIRKVCEFGETGWAVLRPQPGHKSDPNAIAVYIRGIQVGFINPHLSNDIIQHLMLLEKNGVRVLTLAEIQGSGTETDPFHVTLSLSESSVKALGTGLKLDDKIQTAKTAGKCGCVALLVIFAGILILAKSCS